MEGALCVQRDVARGLHTVGQQDAGFGDHVLDAEEAGLDRGILAVRRRGELVRAVRIDVERQFKRHGHGRAHRNGVFALVGSDHFGRRSGQLFHFELDRVRSHAAGPHVGGVDAVLVDGERLGQVVLRLLVVIDGGGHAAGGTHRRIGAVVVADAVVSHRREGDQGGELAVLADGQVVRIDRPHLAFSRRVLAVVNARLDGVLVLRGAAARVRDRVEDDLFAVVVRHRALEGHLAVRDLAVELKAAVLLLGEVAGLGTGRDRLSVHLGEDHQIVGVRLADGARRLRRGKGVVGGEGEGAVLFDLQVHGQRHTRRGKIDRIDARHVDGLAGAVVGFTGSQADRHRGCQDKGQQDHKKLFHSSVS